MPGVTPLELPGIGTRKNEKSPLRVYDYVDDLRRLYLAEKYQGPKGLLGISFGGMIAQSWLSQYQSDFLFAALINTSAKILSPAYKRLTPKALSTLCRTTCSINKEKRIKTILQGTTNLIKIDPPLITKWLEYENEYPTSSLSFIRQLFAAYNFSPVKSIKTPIAIFLSAQDSFVSPQCSKQLAEFYQAPLFIHKTAGHDLPLDDPQWLLNALRESYDTIPKTHG
ncbi:MAG: alpha/beta hydrolase [Bdellovibrionota bacterium]